MIGENRGHGRALALVAMKVEEDAILGKLGHYCDVEISRRFELVAKAFRRNGRELLLVNCGIGLVNAGAITALCCEKFGVDGVLLFGVAGAISQELEIGDLVIASQIIQHDSYFSGESGNEMMAPGAPYVSISPELRQSPYFETDETFNRNIALALAGSTIRYKQGNIISGSEFVGSALSKVALASRFPNALAVEMEASGIAVVARRLCIPFSVLKTVADRLNPDRSISMDYNRFLKSAAGNVGEVIQRAWNAWSS